MTNNWRERPRPAFPAQFQDLAGKSVFITGGGSGIGAALTEAFLVQGARVAFVQRSDAFGFCRDMEATHGNAPLFLPCDITDTVALKKAVADATAAHGPIDVLVNNAANDSRHATEDVTEDFWQQTIDINLKCYFFACQAVLPGMRAKGEGSIINFSSVAYMMGLEGMPIYTASNAAITALTRSLAREFGPDSIRVNAVAPGMVLTDRQKRLWLTPESVAEHIDGRQCLKEALVPEDIAGGTLFLASGASRMMTGQVLIIDGGVATGGT